MNTSEENSLFNQLFELPFKAALIRCLDEQRQPLSYASGFTAEKAKNFEELDSFPSNTLLTVGDKLYVVGFPYGFSAHGANQPPQSY